MSNRCWWVLCCLAVLCAVDAASAQSATHSAGEPKSAFDHFLIDGGWITHFVLLPLSVATFALTVDHLITIRRGALMPEDMREGLTEQFRTRRFKEALDATAEDPCMLAQVVHTGMSRANQGTSAMQRAMEEVLESRSAVLFRRIEYLNIIGNISPMIGLFGTVFGMIHTFSTIVEEGGQPDATLLAQGISVALVTTFWGLLVAIPALSIFHVMRNRIDGLVSECAEFAEELMASVKPAARSADAAPRGERAPVRPKPAAAAVAGE